MWTDIVIKLSYVIMIWSGTEVTDGVDFECGESFVCNRIM